GARVGRVVGERIPMAGKICLSLLLCVSLIGAASAQVPAVPALPMGLPAPAPGDDGILPQARVLPSGGDGAADQPLELVEFRDLPLVDAMRLLSQQSGMRIVPSAQAGRTSISLYLQDVTALTAIAALCQANGLIYRRDPGTGIVRIFTSKENQ